MDSLANLISEVLQYNCSSNNASTAVIKWETKAIHDIESNSELIKSYTDESNIKSKNIKIVANNLKDKIIEYHNKKETNRDNFAARVIVTVNTNNILYEGFEIISHSIWDLWTLGKAPSTKPPKVYFSNDQLWLRKYACILSFEINDSIFEKLLAPNKQYNSTLNHNIKDTNDEIAALSIYTGIRLIDKLKNTSLYERKKILVKWFHFAPRILIDELSTMQPRNLCLAFMALTASCLISLPEESQNIILRTVKVGEILSNEKDEESCGCYDCIARNGSKNGISRNIKLLSTLGVILQLYWQNKKPDVSLKLWGLIVSYNIRPDIKEIQELPLHFKTIDTNTILSTLKYTTTESPYLQPNILATSPIMISKEPLILKYTELDCYKIISEFTTCCESWSTVMELKKCGLDDLSDIMRNSLAGVEQPNIWDKLSKELMQSVAIADTLQNMKTSCWIICKISDEIKLFQSSCSGLTIAPCVISEKYIVTLSKLDQSLAHSARVLLDELIPSSLISSMLYNIIPQTWEQILQSTEKVIESLDKVSKLQHCTVRRTTTALLNKYLDSLSDEILQRCSELLTNVDLRDTTYSNKDYIEQDESLINIKVFEPHTVSASMSLAEKLLTPNDKVKLQNLVKETCERFLYFDLQDINSRELELLNCCCETYNSRFKIVLQFSLASFSEDVIIPWLSKQLLLFVNSLETWSNNLVSGVDKWNVRDYTLPNFCLFIKAIEQVHDLASLFIVADTGGIKLSNKFQSYPSAINSKRNSNMSNLTTGMNITDIENNDEEKYSNMKTMKPTITDSVLSFNNTVLNKTKKNLSNVYHRLNEISHKNILYNSENRIIFSDLNNINNSNKNIKLNNGINNSDTSIAENFSDSETSDNEKLQFFKQRGIETNTTTPLPYIRSGIISHTTAISPGEEFSSVLGYNSDNKLENSYESDLVIQNVVNREKKGTLHEQLQDFEETLKHCAILMQTAPLSQLLPEMLSVIRTGLDRVK